MASPASKFAPVIVCVVTEATPATVHAHVYPGVVSAGSMSFQPAGVQVKVVPSPPLVGLIDTLVMDGGVLPMVTGALVTGVPGSCPSVGVAVQAMASPELKLMPVMV
jgi:hypothetical protein